MKAAVVRRQHDRGAIDLLWDADRLWTDRIMGRAPPSCLVPAVDCRSWARTPRQYRESGTRRHSGSKSKPPTVPAARKAREPNEAPDAS